MSLRGVPTNEDLDPMVDNCGYYDVNESNLADESECEYFKRKSTATSLTLYGF